MRAPTILPRIIAFPTGANLSSVLETADTLGFRQVLQIAPRDGFSPALSASSDDVAELVENARQQGLSAWFELAIDECPIDYPLVSRLPDSFAIRHAPAQAPVDPRRRGVPKGRALARFDQPGADALIDWWTERVADLARAGVSGFFVRRPNTASVAIWRRLIGEGKAIDAGTAFLADTPGLPRQALRALEGSGFDFCLSSLPWWDGRASWLIEEHAALRAVAAVVALLGAPYGIWPRATTDRLRVIALAAATGTGMIMPSGFERTPDGAPSAEIAGALSAANGLFERDPVIARSGSLRSLTGPGATVIALLRTPEADPRIAKQAALVLHNPDAVAEAAIDPAILAEAGADFAPAPADGASIGGSLAAGEVRIVSLQRARMIKTPPPDIGMAAVAPRVAIEAVTPSVDAGAYAVKRLFGETVVVEADIFADGHEQIAAALLYRPDDAKRWCRVPMVPVVNDRWRAQFPLDRLGRHVFAIEAWIDRWGGFLRDIGKKRDAGVGTAQDVAEGLALLRATARTATGRAARVLAKAASRIEGALGDPLDVLLAPDLALAMAEADPRPFRAISAEYPVQADRQSAAFAAWYELFPRSQTADADRHGTLTDVIGRLPDIARMGFDVVYFPPIHPIGRKNRKGRNNALTAAPGDPGSPYAIGSADGGHDAIHPELGTHDDFRRLVAAAHDHGLEIALDFAVQCSPDHPWLTGHPEWFAWRPDGSIRYAENPPKKYEDIVNVDFYASAAIPGLWHALRDVIVHWIGEGVRIFRVDNPHTKPLPFWEWLIADIRAHHPDVIFLAEAFTRPKLMYRLAKLGFTQSYTYFTWRNTKAELTEYLTELNQTPVRECFRPHFFVNTPDINPYFLQTSGRAGFLIRAALAATLSGLWGLYSGFELCEFEALPGREEYKDSEKYEIRPRDWSRPGNIIAEISALNRIRKAEPALQTHLGLRFYTAFNDRILYFGKRVPGQRDMILVAISLDPHQPQDADFELPLWEWGLSDYGTAEIADLLRETRFVWTGKVQHVGLTPDAPYAIWRVQPAREV